MKTIQSKNRSELNLKLLNSICSSFNTVEANGFASLVNYASLSDEPVHRWFRYREGYSTQLVKKLITGLPKGSIILDPFCGCGTTLIASQELGYESYGFDINPIAVLVSKVKTRHYTSTDLFELESVKKSSSKLSHRFQSDPAPLLSIIDKVFHPEILGALLRLRHLIKSVEKQHIKDFLMVAWLSILEEVSNVYKEGNGIKYRNRQRTPAGYVTIPDSEWQLKLFPADKFSFCKYKFLDQLSIMIDDAKYRNVKKLPVSHVFNAPAETVHQYLRENSTAFIVFSPPYCNCFNYFKIFKIELWMGEFIKSYHDLQVLNRTAMRSHVETKMDRDYDSRIPFVHNFVELIDVTKLWDRRIPKAVHGYFVDMKKILENLHKVLKPAGKCVIVVGNSSYSGIIIPTDALLAKLSNELGFTVEKISVARHLTTSSQQKLMLEDRKQYLRESLVILQKPDPRHQERSLVYVDEIPSDVKINNNEVFVIKNGGLTNLTHKFHRYPGKFIPHIPRWAIKKYLPNSTGKLILDPFCGSGTTLVESMIFGHNAYGIDVDYIARLVSAVKTTPIKDSALVECIKEVKKYVQSNKKGKYKPSIPTLRHWFNDQAIKDLSVIRDAIELFRAKKKIYNFLLVCYLAIIRRASNADNQTQKTYVSHTYKKTPEPAKDLFFSILDNYSERLMAFSSTIDRSVKSTILPFNDARTFGDAWLSHNLPKVDLAITSPPYIKSVDYVYNQMAEYFWIGDLYNMETQPQQNEYKKKYIGTRKTSSAIHRTLNNLNIDSIDKVVEKIFVRDKKNSYVVYQYFHDMLLHFREMKKVLSRGSHYVMVVGDSLVSGEPILVHRLIQDCGKAAGFEVVNVFGYEIRNRSMRFPRQGRGGIVKYDWIVDFKLAR